MNYKIKKSKRGDTLTVVVTLPKLESYDKSYKIDAMRILRELDEVTKIVRILSNKTVEASVEEDVVVEYEYLLQKEKKKTTTKKTTTKTKKEETTSDE